MRGGGGGRHHKNNKYYTLMTLMKRKMIKALALAHHQVFSFLLLSTSTHFNTDPEQMEINAGAKTNVHVYICLCARHDASHENWCVKNLIKWSSNQTEITKTVAVARTRIKNIYMNTSSSSLSSLDPHRSRRAAVTVIIFVFMHVRSTHCVRFKDRMGQEEVNSNNN